MNVEKIWSNLKNTLAKGGIYPIGTVYDGKIVLCGEMNNTFSSYSKDDIIDISIDVIYNLLHDMGYNATFDIINGVWIIELEEKS